MGGWRSYSRWISSVTVIVSPGGVASGLTIAQETDGDIVLCFAERIPLARTSVVRDPEGAALSLREQNWSRTGHLASRIVAST